MKNEEIKNFVEKVINDKMQLLLDRIDKFQSNVFKDIEKLKDLDELAKFTLPKEFSARDEEADGAAEIATLNEYVKKIASASNQLLLIGSIIEGINRCCDRAALFLLRDDKLVGWRGKGFSGENGQISDEELKRIFFSLSANTVLKSVIETKKNYLGDPLYKPDDFLIYNRFGGGKPKKIFVLPFFVKGKPQAVIYADSLTGAPIKTKVIEILATVGELSLDLLPHPPEAAGQDQDPGIRRGHRGGAQDPGAHRRVREDIGPDPRERPRALRPGDHQRHHPVQQESGGGRHQEPQPVRGAEGDPAAGQGALPAPLQRPALFRGADGQHPGQG